MAIRPYGGVQAIGAASQPVFGTTLTAATTPSTDVFTGTNSPGTSPPPITLTVASSVGLKVDDRVLVGPKANFTPANAKSLDQGTIASIVDATHITVQGLLQAHASGDFLVLNETASFVQVLPVAAAAVIYLGNASTVAAADSSVFDVIAPVTGAQPTYWHQSFTTGLGNSYMTSEYWIAGTATQTFVARFTQD